MNAESGLDSQWQECIDMCERITGGEFGYYAIANNWYEPFDWNNEMCNEVILGFPGSYGLTSWHLQNDKRTVYGRALPYGCEKYLKIEGNGSRNPKYALSPSYNNQQPRALFDYELGMVTQKFAKYAGDKRYKQYVNTSNNTREGMFFMEGKIANSSISGDMPRIRIINMSFTYLIKWDVLKVTQNPIILPTRIIRSLNWETEISTRGFTV